jgi:hypothetical protein
MKVKLAEGRALRDPDTRQIMTPDEVREVPASIYWTRRLRDGDVVLVDDPAPRTRAAAKED